MAGPDRQTDGELLERTRQETKKPELYKVVLLNDDYTTMEFVVEVLETMFQKSAGRSLPHHDAGPHAGQGLCGVYPGKWRKPRSRRSSTLRARHGLPAAGGDGTDSSTKESSTTCSVARTRNRSHHRATARRCRGGTPYLTLEHLLYALAHDPDGERILARLRRRSRRSCARDLDDVPRRVGRAVRARPANASRSRRWRSAACCRRRCCTCRARSAQEVQSATSSRRSCSSRSRTPRSCSPRRASRGSTCSNTSRTASAKTPPAGRRARRRPGDADAGAGERRHRRRRAIRCRPTASNLTDRARAGPARSADRPRATSCSGRSRCCAAAARTTRCSSATPASARPRWPKAWRTRLLGDDVPDAARRTPRSSRSTPARCSPARASAATSRSASRRSSRRSARGRKPILFIDEIHSTVGAGAITGGTMDLATLHQADPHGRRAPRHRLDDVRGVQAHREGPRARAAPAEDRHRRAVDRGDGAGSSRACAAATKSITA